MGSSRSIIVLFLLLPFWVSGQDGDVATTIRSLQAKVRNLEQQVERLSGTIPPQEAPPRVTPLDVSKRWIPPDSQYDAWVDGETVRCKSMEWYTENWQLNLYQFLTNGTYVSSSLTSTNWGYTNANDYAVLVRHNVAGGVPTLKYAKVSTMPDGTNMYDTLYWHTNGLTWVILPFATTNCMVLQRKQDGTLGYDWTRFYD